MTKTPKYDSTADPFDAAWRGLETCSGCDAIGGMEYDRVRREWHVAGKPVDVEGFISKRVAISSRVMPS